MKVNLSIRQTPGYYHTMTDLEKNLFHFDDVVHDCVRQVEKHADVVDRADLETKITCYSQMEEEVMAAMRAVNNVDINNIDESKWTKKWEEAHWALIARKRHKKERRKDFLMIVPVSDLYAAKNFGSVSSTWDFQIIA